MSGICGILTAGGGHRLKEELRSMMAAAAHRFRRPDSFTVSGTGVALASDQLCEVEPGEGSSVAPGSRAVVVADARIDNARELAKQLGLHDGRPLDVCQLLLHAYDRWGTSMPERLVGDFAFAIWDARTNQILLARDPMGMRSLYVRAEPRRLLFASEARQILAAAAVPCAIHEPAIADHLNGSFHFLEETSYRGILHLRPGHLMHGPVGATRVRRYAREFPFPATRYDTLEDYAEHFLELFAEAVRCRLTNRRSGLFLSGGLDSCSIAATAGWMIRRGALERQFAPHAFSFSYQTFAECDERAVSRLVVEQYQLPSTDIPADEAAPLSDFPHHGPHADDPFALVYQPVIERTLAAARDLGLDMMLGGNRGDLVGGESIYNPAYLIRRAALRRLWLELALQGSWRGKTALSTGLSLLRRFARELAEGIPVLRAPLRQIRTRRGHTGLVPWIQPDLAARVQVVERLQATRPSIRIVSRARARRWHVIHAPMQVRVVTHTERIHAAAGLAFADPWSDVRLARFAASIPQRVLNRPGEEKRLTRAAMKGIMGEEARLAARKIAPTPVMEYAIRVRRQAVIRELLHEMRSEEMGFVNAASLRRHYDDVLRGEPLHPEFWSALTLEMWLRQYWAR